MDNFIVFVMSLAMHGLLHDLHMQKSRGSTTQPELRKYFLIKYYF